jgi:hypothetical protein
MVHRSELLLASFLLLPLGACGRAGEVTAAAAVEIRDLPAYPGATEIAHDIRAGHWGYHHGSVARHLLADASLDQVKAFYQKVIAEHGWQVIIATESHGGFHWHLFQGSSLGDIELTPRADGKVEIFLERHDH